MSTTVGAALCNNNTFRYVTESIRSNTLWFLTCDKCTYCKLLWTKVSAKCPKFNIKVNVNLRKGSEYLPIQPHCSDMESIRADKVIDCTS